MRRLLGAALTGAGGGLLLFVAATQVRAELARDHARAAWAADEAHAAAESARALGSRESGPTARGASVGRLVIPSIGLDEVVVEGVDERQLVGGPGHLPGSVFPGEIGNAVISAHRDRHFRNLDDVAVGDTVVTQTRNHQQTWRVTERRVVRGSAPVIRSSPDRQLTLTTCWPVRYFGPAPDRLIITAIAVSSAAADDE